MTVKRSNLTQEIETTETTGYRVDNDDTIEYLNYFDLDNDMHENEYSRFEEFILEANIKSVSYAFKIFSMELFEIIYLQ